MKRLWILINGLKIKSAVKNRLYLGVLILTNISIGGAVWMLLGRFLLPGIEWMICFMGYPAIFVGFFGGVLYLYNHKFA